MIDQTGQEAAIAAVLAAWPQGLRREDGIDQPVLIVQAALIRPLCEELKRQGFDMLMDLTAVDWLPTGREPRFDVVYHLFSTRGMWRVRIKAGVGEADPVIDSLVPLWPAANWPEREVWDLFGIRFEGHPNLQRIMMPDDWEGFPLRKDYPLEGTERPAPIVRE